MLRRDTASVARNLYSVDSTRRSMLARGFVGHRARVTESRLRDESSRVFVGEVLSVAMTNTGADVVVIRPDDGTVDRALSLATVRRIVLEEA